MKTSSPGNVPTGLLAVLALAAAVVIWLVAAPEAPSPPMPPRASPSAQTASPAGPKVVDGMVLIPAGEFWMGSDDEKPDEKPMHLVALDSFWIDQTEVTNEQFQKFVDATKYVTVAERKPDPKDFPDAPPENLVPGSVVFSPPSGEVPLDNHWIWWKYVPGANWRHPAGPDSSIVGKEKHPVVQVCWDDAAAYAAWAGKRLPTEAEWEYAARGGLEKRPFVWGTELTPADKWQANIWQGRFPNENSLKDGHHSTAPVASFAPNGFGLYDMAGNVWEWCADWYHHDYYARSPKHNPQGPTESYDPNEPGAKKRVQRGGSFLCSDLYCTGYRPSARMKCTPDTGLMHSGFRCVRDVK